MKKVVLSFVAFLMVASVTSLAEAPEDATPDLKEVQCVVAAKAANATKSADYKDGKVYFCCGGCASKFGKDTAKFAVKANYQLVATKQYVQKVCPFSGGELNKETALKIGKAEVAFCCDGCKGKVASAKDDQAKMKLVFNEKSFKKAFAKVKK